MEQEYAGLFRRVGSTIIDMLVLFAIVFCIYSLLFLAVHTMHSPEMSLEVKKNTSTLHNFVSNNLSTLNHMSYGQTDVNYYTLTLDMLSVLFAIIVFFIPPIYYVYYWKIRNATIGEKWLKLKVLGENGETNLSISQLFLRWLVYLLSSLLNTATIVNFLLVIFSSKRQLIHDSLTKTIVVKVKD